MPISSDPTMFDVPSQRVKEFVRQAPTEELLNRLTAFRSGMRADVIPLIEAELQRRDVGRKEIAAHQEMIDQSVIWQAPGLARRCRYCERPATEMHWDWHRLWDTVPIVPGRFYYCDRHRPAVPPTPLEYPTT